MLSFRSDQSILGHLVRSAVAVRVALPVALLLCAGAAGTQGCSPDKGGTEADSPDVESSGDATGGDPDATSDATNSGPDTTPSGCLPADEGGECGECGTLSCVLDALQCDDPGFNPCQGCGELDGVPGESCTVDGEDGTLGCDLETGDLTCSVDPDENACGGTAELDGMPGAACGDCDEGTWRCESPDVLQCEGDPGFNACGTCSDLLREPGTACGCDDGEWTCDGDAAGGVSCTGTDGNACGGCDALAGEPGTSCAAACGEGQWTCAEDLDSVRCVGEGAAFNACGGCDTLAGQPEAPCSGECGAGLWRCAADGETVECSGDDRNPCGSCGSLQAEPGTECAGFGCGPGTVACDPEGDDVLCDAPRANQCGGCEPEPDDFELNAACGCGGTWLCVQGAPTCQGGDSTNACGGCGLLTGTPGQPCGTSNACALWACEEDGNNVFCDDSAEENACGGCATLPDGAAPDQPCGCAGTWQCTSGGEEIRCNLPGNNACGGCEPLAGQPGQPCGTCGTWACSGTDAVTCAGDDTNICGGCSALDALPGDRCNETSCQLYRCDLDGGELFCAPSTPNACGGCGELEAPPLGECGDCGSLWTCTDERDAVSCDTSALNACGGCDTLPGEPRQPCGEGSCALWTCTPEGGMFCDAAEENACGGCLGLGNEGPGEACGACAGDVFVCSDDQPGETVCQQAPRNTCGGCAELEAEPGTPCPCGGDWTCSSDDESVFCPGMNPCGGCNYLDPSLPGTACTPRGSSSGTCGTVVCDGPTNYTCEQKGPNPCGGCFDIAPEVSPGEDCPCGTWACDGPNLTRCPGLNRCGTCGELENDDLVGQSCGDAGTCGRWTCTESGVECVSRPPNACGGCLPLPPGSPGRPCGCSGVTICDGPNAISCDSGNPCGGCEPLANAALLGTTCTPAGGGCGLYECVESDDVGCRSIPVNECGGCTILEANAGSPCGPDGCGTLSCSASLNSLECDTSSCP